MSLNGNAREVLGFYADVFDCEVQLHTFEEMGRSDGPGDWIAHGYLVHDLVSLFASDVADEAESFQARGLMFSLLGTSSPSELSKWFTKLSIDGHIIESLEKRSWGATDGQVRDRYGVHWLVGFMD